MRIIGIGASAGGLAPLEDFFHNMPCDTGIAFLVVQHLAPTEKSLLVELLQRSTNMPVHEAQQNMTIRANVVYVAPSSRELRVHKGILKLAKPVEPRGHRLPINVLFSSLASAENERAIAVVLSGMGSDGTLGLQAIKATGGLSAVQSPESAQFDAMPKSAIEAGCDDIVAPSDELPRRILAYVLRVPELDEPDTVHERFDSIQGPNKSLKRLGPLIGLLQAQTRHDFSLYKPTTLNRRIERRMAIHGISELTDYTRFLENNRHEVQLLFQELLIGVTQFFRDTEAWDYLIEKGLPELVINYTSEHPLRAWVVGCSTGEEAYSLVMAFTESLERIQSGAELNLKVFASDISPDAITTARRGQYPLNIENIISKERLDRFFTRHEHCYQVQPWVRDKVMFASHDVILDPPFTRLDLIACRNLLIYFDLTLQRRILPLFHYSLRPGGLLMLGSSETIGRLTQLFEPLKSRVRLFRRKPFQPDSHSDFLLKSYPPISILHKEQSVLSNDVPQQNTTSNLQSAVDSVLLQLFSPAAVVLNEDADIVYISGRTGKYLEPAAGKATLNIHAMVREGLREPIYHGLKQASGSAGPVELLGLLVRTGSDTQTVDITIQTLDEPDVLEGKILVVFRDAPAFVTSENRELLSTTASDQEVQIQQYQKEIRTLRQRGEKTLEELQATNEKLQSTNEELQSANEELTTSKEEMQSMNEELQTINAELETKVDDLVLAQSDMQNVLNSIEIAILFLDQALNVRRYTERTTDIFSLRKSDVGRPLSDLNTSLRYPQLQEDARKTLDTLSVREKQVASDDDRWFSVRIIPYRRLDNMIDGVVITLVNITETKQLESALRDPP